MNYKITVREALQSDIDTLTGYNIAMALETEQLRLQEAVVEEGVRTLFDSPEYGFYLAAETGGHVVGCLMITYEWSDWRNGLFWWIQSVYVHPDHRRRGVYRAMYEAVRDRAAVHPRVCGCRLYVEKDNQIARKTYARLGMKQSNYKIFEEIFEEKQDE